MRDRKPLPSQEYLRQTFDYDPGTGELRWRRREDVGLRWNSKWPGRIVGHRNSAGGIYVTINGGLYLAHRLIWKLMTDCDPIDEIDHRDMDRMNNRWSNLREASRMENQGNVRAYVTNRLGVKGVRVRKERYQARISVAGRNIGLGTFSTPEEANAAYIKAAEQYFGEFARAA